MYLSNIRRVRQFTIRGNSSCKFQVCQSLHSSSQWFKSVQSDDTRLNLSSSSNGEIKKDDLDKNAAQESTDQYKLMHIEWEKQRLAWLITGKAQESVISDINLSTFYSRLIHLRKNRKKPAIRVNTTSILKNLRNSDPNAVIAFTRPLPLRDMIDIITVLWDEQGLYSSQTTTSAASNATTSSQTNIASSTAATTSGGSSVESSLDSKDDRGH